MVVFPASVSFAVSKSADVGVVQWPSASVVPAFGNGDLSVSESPRGLPAATADFSASCFSFSSLKTFCLKLPRISW